MLQKKTINALFLVNLGRVCFKMETNEIDKIRDNLNFPYVDVNRGCLGGSSVFISLSFDEDDNWENDIFENSRYLRLVVDNEKIEHYSGFSVKSFRKCKYKDVDDIISKLNKYYEDNK